MQFAGNAALDAALAVGQKRYFTIKFMVDWDRDGTFADPNADLSSLVKSADIDRQLTGNYPAELEVTEGYSAAQMVVILEGDAPDGTPVWKLFSPYSALYPGTVAAVNTPCYLDVIVETSAGPVAIRQFTGVVRNGVPSRREGRVHLIVRDAAAQLQAPVSMEAWAVDEFSRTKVTGLTDLADSGTITASSVMDHVLRRSGFFEGPAWHPHVVLAWSLCGSALPEVGTIAMTDAQLNDDVITGYAVTIPQLSPAGEPADIYEPGQYGQVFRGSTMASWPGGRTVDYLSGSAHGSGRVNVLSFGSNDSNMLGIAAWVKIDPAQSGISSIQFHLEETEFGVSAYVEVLVNHNTGLVSQVFTEEGWAETWLRHGTLSPGWHHLTALWVFRSLALDQYVWDGHTPLTMANAGPQGTWPPTPMTLPWPNSRTNHGQVIAKGPMQFAQVFYQANTLNVDYIHPVFVPPSPVVNLDLSTLRLLWRPKVREEAAWNTLREVSAADMGALYVTEHGVVTFDNRETVRSRQDESNVSILLTMDEVQEIDPETVLESVVNSISWGLVRKHAESLVSVFKATKPDQFATEPSTIRTQPVTIGDNVQSIRLGPITYRPAAMGYNLDGTTTIHWQNYMEFYAPGFPDYLGDGYTPYAPGTRTVPNMQPPVVPGAFVSAALGFVDFADQDPAHLRLTMSTPAGSVVWYAVDDGKPFLHVSGTLIVREETDNQRIQDASSIATYGIRTYTLAGGDWLQDATTVPLLAASLLEDTKQPRPFFQSLELVGDPRVQLQDVVRLDDVELGGPIFASVVGIRRRISQTDGVKDAYTMRTFGAIGPSWIMDDPVFSIMDDTTIVS